MFFSKLLLFSFLILPSFAFADYKDVICTADNPEFNVEKQCGGIKVTDTASQNQKLQCVRGAEAKKNQCARDNSFVSCGFDLNGDGVVSDFDPVTKTRKPILIDGKPAYEECGFNDIIATITKIINWLIIFAVSITVLIMAYVGWLFLTAGDSQDKVKRAKGMFWNVIWGFVIMLSAWFIVNIVEKTLIADDSGIKSYLKKPTSP